MSVKIPKLHNSQLGCATPGFETTGSPLRRSASSHGRFPWGEGGVCYLVLFHNFISNSKALEFQKFPSKLDWIYNRWILKVWTNPVEGNFVHELDLSTECMTNTLEGYRVCWNTRANESWNVKVFVGSYSQHSSQRLGLYILGHSRLGIPAPEDYIRGRLWVSISMPMFFKENSRLHMGKFAEWSKTQEKKLLPEMKNDRTTNHKTSMTTKMNLWNCFWTVVEVS